MSVDSLILDEKLGTLMKLPYFKQSALSNQKS
jgi:hypothetical protein